MNTSISSPKDQAVSFVELFFDLVFVFSVTQVVGVIHHGLSWSGVGQAVLIFWLVWWAWTQFTWALNASNTDHGKVQVCTLVATGVVFFMAIAVPNAFHGSPLAFAIPYVLVRLLGLGLYLLVTCPTPSHRKSVMSFALLSLSGLAAVLVGAILGGEAVYWGWGLAMALDLYAAFRAGKTKGFEILHEHFVERHALFMIIALGEGLIVAASAVSGGFAWSASSVGVAIFALGMIFCMWWTYFPVSKPRLEKEFLKLEQGFEKTAFARDVYSLAHFPMVCGIIAFAVVIETALAHPTEPLSGAYQWLLAASVFLYVGSIGAALWRATHQFPLMRMGLAMATSGILVLVSGVPVIVSVGIALTGILLVALIENKLQNQNV